MDVRDGQAPARDGRNAPDAERAAATARARTVLAGLSLGCLAVGLLAAGLGADLVRASALGVFCVAGVGSAPWQLERTMGLPARLAVTVLTGVAVFVLGASAMMTAGAWYPRVAFACLLAVCAPLHAVGGWRALREWRAAPVPGRAAALSPAVVAAAGALLSLGTAVLDRPLEPGIGGFPAAIGPAWYAGLALLLVAFVAARDGDRAPAVPVVLLMLVLTVTPALVYDGPRSQSAFKHVDLIQQIRTAHRPDSIVEVYDDWSGFFAAVAWLCDVAGIRDPMRLAAFWPPLVGALRLVALRYLAGQWLTGARQCWLAAALVLLVDSVGTDYFSPQSLSMVLALVTFGLALSRRDGPVRPALVLLAGCTLAVSHQLTPYIVGGALVILVLLRQVRPWWLPALVLVPAGVWSVVHRAAVSRFVHLDQLGRLHNFRPPSSPTAPGLHRLPIVTVTVLAMLLAVAVLGLPALLALLRHRREVRYWAIAACPAAGVGLVALNPYGQEGVFRAAVFAFPWLALLAVTRMPCAPGVRERLTLLATLAVLTGTYVVAAFGLDAGNVSRPADVAAFVQVQREARERPESMTYLLQLGPGDLPGPVPTRASAFRWFTGPDIGDESLARQLPAAPQGAAQVRRTTRELLRYSREPLGVDGLYVIWSPASAHYAHEYGMWSPGRFAALRDAFAAAPDWETGFQRDGTVVFRFVPERYQGAS
ncbi:hypothetical protein [Actinoplanes sp. NPDC049681]|uniref:hypothetical protein n=1 Tax=Actinoplanes sp. NPDC049681 TaxID=3363905 RepID=UPI0037A9B7B0